MSDIETTTTERTKVGFPEAPAPEEKSGFNFGSIFIFLLVLILLGGAIWFIFFRNQGEITTSDVSETPTVVEEVTNTETPTPVAISKESIKIQILNGSGISGLAGKLQSALETSGYSGIEVGNADNYNYKTTEVAFSDSIPVEIKSDISATLEKLYGSVVTKTNSSSKYDVVVTIGYPKGFTPSPATSRTTSTPTITPTTGLTGTVTPTRRPTSTLTPTP